MLRAFLFPMIFAIATSSFAVSSTADHPGASMTLQSDKGRYVVRVEPPTAAPPINQLHSWKIKLSLIDGAPVNDARFKVDGGMPQHGHGLPTRPQVTRDAADGTYRLDGVKFNMSGLWQMKFDIDSGAGADAVTFNTVVRDPSDKR